MPTGWPPVDYGEWSATCDTLHAHTQVLGKLAARLSPPEPRFQHVALRLTARGWETLPLPAPDGSGALTATLDLQGHRALAQHSDGRAHQVPLTPNRAVGEVTQELLDAVHDFIGPVQIDLTPREVSWSVPLDEDRLHAHYDPAQVARYMAAATQAALALAAFRAPYPCACTPVNAWWGSFDLAVSLFSGTLPTDSGALPADSGAPMDSGTPPTDLSTPPVDPGMPPADAPGDSSSSSGPPGEREIAVGWWPGDERYPRAAFYAYASPTPEGFAAGRLASVAARWEGELGEYILDWNDVRLSPDPQAVVLQFARAVLQQARHGLRYTAL